MFDWWCWKLKCP
jgi:hypothetical protein